MPLRHISAKVHIRSSFALLAVAGAFLTTHAEPAAAQAPAPPGLLGLAPQLALTEEDVERMAQAQVRSIRLPLGWYQVARTDPSEESWDWSGFERDLALAAEHGIRVLPFFWGTPGWIAAEPRVEPVFSADVRRRWAGFLQAAVRRYGPDGSFWQTHPELPPLAIRWWQIWNEPNIVSFSLRPNPRRYARLVRISARALRSIDPDARILTAGVFGRTRHTPPNIRPSNFLRRALRGTGLKHLINGVALHPYLPRAREIPSKIVAMRGVLRDLGMKRIPLWITEMGWGSDSLESDWEVGWTGQARELNRALSLLTRSRRRWRIQRIFWYSWIDADACQFCDSAGLFTRDGEAKPAWYAFNRWTGGDPQLP